MKLLTAHRHLNDKEKNQFQDLIDDFFEQWIDLFGEEGIKNYIHVLGSGHMLYFLEKYNCLYIYSQQGWEDLNNRMPSLSITQYITRRVWKWSRER